MPRKVLDTWEKRKCDIDCPYLLLSHKSGAPVVDENGKFFGFVSKFDLLKAI
jgi:hypothetical protein